MYKSKTKTYSNISLDEIKEDLRIAQSDNSYNGQITRLLKSAVDIAEKFIAQDIVPTTTVQEDYNINCSWYQINVPNITVTEILKDDVTPITGYSLYKFKQYTLINFYNILTADKVKITYTSGSAVIPPSILRAISIKTAELFDADRSGYVNGAMKETKAFERLLSPYINLIA